MCKECLERAIPEDLSTSRPQETGPLANEDLQAMVEAHMREQRELIKQIVPPYTPPDIDPLGR